MLKIYLAFRTLSFYASLRRTELKQLLAHQPLERLDSSITQHESRLEDSVVGSASAPKAKLSESNDETIAVTILQRKLRHSSR